MPRPPTRITQRELLAQILVLTPDRSIRPSRAFPGICSGISSWWCSDMMNPETALNKSFLTSGEPLVDQRRFFQNPFQGRLRETLQARGEATGTYRKLSQARFLSKLWQCRATLGCGFPDRESCTSQPHGQIQQDALWEPPEWAFRCSERTLPGSSAWACWTWMEAGVPEREVKRSSSFITWDTTAEADVHPLHVSTGLLVLGSVLRWSTSASSRRGTQAENLVICGREGWFRSQRKRNGTHRISLPCRGVRRSKEASALSQAALQPHPAAC